MNWLRKFMMGRYGLDQMGIGILFVMMACTLISSLTRFWPLHLIGTILMIWVIFRIMSRNTSARAAENQKFLIVWDAVKRWWQKVLTWFRTRKMRFDDRKTHRYFRCPNCKKQLRVPRGHGKIEITCPVCHTKFFKKS